MMTYVLGKRSRTELVGVHPKLVAIVERAIEVTEQDFTVHDGIRTLSQQQHYVAQGVSKTMHSKHLPQEDGYGHAVDLVPWVDGRPRWEWPLIFKIAVAMDTACTEAGVNLRWGGVWDRRMFDYGGSPERMKEAVDAYCARHPGPDFIDGPHYEL